MVVTIVQIVTVEKKALNSTITNSRLDYTALLTYFVENTEDLVDEITIRQYVQEATIDAGGWKEMFGMR